MAQNITELKQGDDIIVTLLRSRPATPTGVGNQIIYCTSNNYKRTPHEFTGGQAIVLANAGKILRIQFTSRPNANVGGVAELDYAAIQSIYIWEGESNADTVVMKRKLDFELEIPVKFPHTMPPMKIYKKKVNLIWTDSK